jgi:hypothetical protein
LLHIRTLQDYIQCGGIKDGCYCTQLEHVLSLVKKLGTATPRALIRGDMWERRSQLSYILLTRESVEI